MAFSPAKKANLLMLIVVFFWGLSYLFTRQGLESLSVFNFIALRFGVGFVAAALIFAKHFSAVNKKTIYGGAVLGFFLFLVFTGLNYGIQFTTISNAGFLGSLTVLFVPILSSLIDRKRPEKKIVVGSLSATAGIALLTLESAAGFGFGDLICILAAAFYAGHILMTKRLTEQKETDALNLGIAQLGFTCLYGIAATFLFETPQLPQNTQAWTAVLFLGLFCTAFGFVAQTLAQKDTTPSHIGLIFALEPVFAAIFAWLFVSEELLPIQILGAAVVFASVLAVETDFFKRAQRRVKKS